MKGLLKLILEMIKRFPNDQELGKNIRHHFKDYFVKKN